MTQEISMFSTFFIICSSSTGQERASIAMYLFWSLQMHFRNLQSDAKERKLLLFHMIPVKENQLLTHWSIRNLDSLVSSCPCFTLIDTHLRYSIHTQVGCCSLNVYNFISVINSLILELILLCRWICNDPLYKLSWCMKLLVSATKCIRNRT